MFAAVQISYVNKKVLQSAQNGQLHCTGQAQLTILHSCANISDVKMHVHFSKNHLILRGLGFKAEAFAFDI